MKKSLLALVAILALAMVSCGNNNNPDTPSKPDRKIVEAGVSEFSWYADENHNGTHSFHLTLIEDLQDKNGYSLHVVFDAASTDPVGEYVVGNGEVGTMIPGNYDGNEPTGSFIAMLEGGKYQGIPETLESDDAHLSISRMGDNFVITFVNEGYEFKASCEAKIRNEAYPSEPMDATVFTAKFAAGSALYYGDLYGHGLSDEYLLSFHGDHYASILLYAPLNSPDNAIPDGTYTISSTGEAGTITPGGSARGYFDPSYIYLAMGGQTITTVWYMYAGSITFVNDNGVYSVTGTITSACGSQITINYSGPIDVEAY